MESGYTEKPSHHTNKESGYKYMTMIVGVTGKAGAGKDTVANALAKHHCGRRTSFAFVLKSMLCTMLGVPYEMLEGVTKESREWRETPLPDIGKSPRELMLTLGTEWGRGLVNPDLWVFLVDRQWHAHLRANGFEAQPFIFSDVRFDNEAMWIRSQGGIVLEVVRLDDHVQSDAAAAHSSEAGVGKDLLSASVSANFGELDALIRRSIKVVDQIIDEGVV